MIGSRLPRTYSHPRYEHMPQLDAMEAAANAVLQRLGGEAPSDVTSTATDAATDVTNTANEGGEEKEADSGPRKTLILLSA